MPAAKGRWWPARWRGRARTPIDAWLWYRALGVDLLPVTGWGVLVLALLLAIVAAGTAAVLAVIVTTGLLAGRLLAACIGAPSHPRQELQWQ